MLRYLDQGAPLLGALLAVVVGLLGHNLSQAWAARALGDLRPHREGYDRVARRQFDILGVIAALLTVGAWGFAAAVPLDGRLSRRTRTALALLAGPLFLVALSAVCFAVAHAAGAGFGASVALDAGLVSAGLFITSLIPVPPLALGRVLWMWAPTTGGWVIARYRLEEEPLGRFVGFAVLMLPVIFRSLPDPVGELAGSLSRHLVSAIGG